MTDRKRETSSDFDTEKLRHFVFGDPDAKSDEILVHCFQKINGVEEFLSGTKNIVLGERGAGKSALFKLVSEGEFKFNLDKKEKPRKQIIVPIEDDLEYIAIANVIENRFTDKTKRAHGKYRYLWELYILSRILEKIEEDIGSDEEIRTLRNDFGVILGIAPTKDFRLRDLLTLYKVTVGGKFDSAGSVTPTLSVEPAKDGRNSTPEVTDYEIGQFRNRLKKLIKAKNSVVIVLIDKIDDFVIGLDYEEQLKNIQALVECTQAYRFPEIKLKIFLRADLYKRLNFERGGYDKIAPQVVQLEWSKDDICEFVARRLHYNFQNLQIKLPAGDISLSHLDLDPSLRNQLKDILNKPSSLKDYLILIGKLPLLITKIKWSLFKKKSHTARKTDLLQEVFLKLITYIFPHRVIHYSMSCRKEDIPFETFLDTHFKFGSEHPNPRLILLFLQFTFESASHYFSKNPDQKLLKPNEIDEYELILKEHVLAGYHQLQETARNTVAQLNTEWRTYIERLFHSLNQPKTCCNLTIDIIKNNIDWQSSDEELKRFIVFFTHVGLFVPENPSAAFDKRTFSLPVVMKTCSGH